MSFLEALILAIVQGLTEFLPVSSSAHLILAPYLFGWDDQGRAFDVAVHVGTLGAVVHYFRNEVWDMAKATIGALRGGRWEGDALLALQVAVATIPCALAGLMIGQITAIDLRDPAIIALATVAFGLLLLWADRMERGSQTEYGLRWRYVWAIGFAQALALIPGTSRSGITMTAALMMGMTRQAAARFSFLLSIPVITLAGGYESLSLIGQPNEVPWGALAVGVIASFVSAWLTIHWFLKLLDKVGFLPFVIYRLLLGAYLYWALV